MDRGIGITGRLLKAGAGWLFVKVEGDGVGLVLRGERGGKVGGCYLHEDCSDESAVRH